MPSEDVVTIVIMSIVVTAIVLIVFYWFMNVALSTTNTKLPIITCIEDVLNQPGSYTFVSYTPYSVVATGGSNILINNQPYYFPSNSFISGNIPSGCHVFSCYGYELCNYPAGCNYYITIQCLG